MYIYKCNVKMPTTCAFKKHTLYVQIHIIKNQKWLQLPVKWFRGSGGWGVKEIPADQSRLQQVRGSLRAKGWDPPGPQMATGPGFANPCPRNLILAKSFKNQIRHEKH